MPTRFSINVPDDFDLARDLCSYGYFLLRPNHWDPLQRVFTRILTLPGGVATLRITQGAGHPTPRRAPGADSTTSTTPTNPASVTASPDPGTPLRIESNRELSREDRAAARVQITRMLRLDEDAEHARRFHQLDPRFKTSGRFRLFRSPTLFEDVIKTVTSCNVAWTSTILMNRKLCDHFGTRGAFPTPARLARTAPALLRGRCSVGYRDARIIDLAKLFTGKSILVGARRRRLNPIDPAWLENPAVSDDQIHDALIQLPGIGPYAAANVMQLLGRYSRLPLDTESVRHGKTVLSMKGTSAQIMKKVNAHFAPMGDQAFRSYWFELWEFYEAKHGPAWTWQRDSTGRMFTAAKLAK